MADFVFFRQELEDLPFVFQAYELRMMLLQL